MICEYCKQIPHHNRCPLAPEPKFKYFCSICGNGIYDGEEYVKNADNEYVHYDCPTTRELINFLGFEIETMRGDEY